MQKKQRFRNFLEYLTSLAKENNSKGNMAKFVIRDVQRGGGAAFIGENLNLGKMTKNLLSINAPDSCIDSLTEAYNEWIKIEEEERLRWKTRR